MFEDQKSILDFYQKNGVGIGKVQVSSALKVRFDQLSSEEKLQASLQVLAQHANLTDKIYN